jgi:peptidoglycan LD-endopeptidase CwlK
MISPLLTLLDRFAAEHAALRPAPEGFDPDSPLSSSAVPLYSNGITFDPRTERNIATLHPRAQKVARDFMARAMTVLGLQGYTVQIISGTRTYDQQAELYAQGRSKAGRIVTNAPAGYSNHNFGIAFDIGIFDAQRRYIDDLPAQGGLLQQTVTKLYRSLGPIGVAMGETWGGNWKSFTDEPHYELHPEWAANMTENEMLAELRRRHQNGRDIFE